LFKVSGFILAPVALQVRWVKRP